MKTRLIGIVLIMAFFGMGAPAQAMSSDIVASGHDGPYPWGTEIEFPWQKIEDLWEADFGNFTLYYWFEVTPQQDAGESVRLLKITEYRVDREGFLIVQRTGIGSEVENSRIVYGKVKNTHSFHDLVVRAYKNPKTNETETVINLVNIRSHGQKEPYAILRRVNFGCGPMVDQVRDQVNLACAD